MPREVASRTRESSGRDYSTSKERSHSSTSSSSSRRDNKSSPRDGVSSTGNSSKSRHAESDHREKHGDRESSAKKSRLKPPPVVSTGSHKASTAGTDRVPPPNSDTGITPCTLDKFELYASANKYDEDEARGINADEATEIMLQNYAELEEMMIAVFEARKNAKSQAEIAELVSRPEILEIEDRSSGIVAINRRINRLLKLKLKQSKDETLELRQNSDKDHLQLQNLIYEAGHLKKQVIAVKDYKSVDEKIDLVPLEQFYKEAPPSIANLARTEDPHMLRIARLEFEFLQRQDLSQQCVELEKQKTDVTEDIANSKKRLEAVKPILSNILQALEPAQEFFDPEYKARREMYKTAEYLPSHLYMLYVSSVGYQEFLGKKFFKISITGDVEAAKETVKDVEEPVKVDSDSEMEVDEPAETEQSDRRVLRKHASIAEERQDHAKKIVETHPLHLEWKISGENGESLIIKFNYLLKLKIVTVETSLQISDVTDKFSDLINQISDRILEEIYKGDSGDHSPNPSTLYYLGIAGVTSFSELIPSVGRPYNWAQELAGLIFPKENEADSVESDPNILADYDFLPRSAIHNPNVKAARMDNTFKRIYSRLNSQSQLWIQIKNLEMRTILIPSELKKFFPVKNSATFVSWEAIDWTSYKSYPAAIYPVSIDLVKSTSFFFRAIVERGRARVIAVVALTLNYPHEAPIFSVQLEDTGVGQSRVDACVFREVERELNVFCVKEFGKTPSILTLQLQRLIYCVDISLETMSEDDSVGPSEFAREKLFETRVKGKGFRRPFKYVSSLGGHFTQRF